MTVHVTLIGNATADPELRFTPKGDAQATFTLAVNERIKQGNEWVDGEAAFYRVTAWRKLGEQVAEHLRKGSACVVVGKLKPREYETKEGQKRIGLNVDADEIGANLKYMKIGSPKREPSQDPWDAPPQDDIPPF